MSLFKSLEGTSTQVSEETYKDMYLNFEDALSSAVECLNEGIQMVDELNNVQFAMECIAAHKNSSMASMEAFTGCKVTAEGRLSMEGDDAEKTLVQKIKDWFKVLWAKFQDFFNKFSLFAQAAVRKLKEMKIRLGNNKFKAEKLKGSEAKCLSINQLTDINKTISDASAITIGSAGKGLGDVVKTNVEPETKLDETFDLNKAGQYIDAHVKTLTDIISAKQTFNATFKKAIDSVKISGATGSDKTDAYRKARLDYHVALRTVHLCSGAVVRSANKLLAACAKAYKGGMKD